MITKLLQKQIHSELEYVYENLYDFVKKFIDEETAEEIMEVEDLEFFIAFESNFVYIQKHWMDEDGETCVTEYHIDYEDYNDWCEGDK